MKLLLDTHPLIWSLTNAPDLSKDARARMNNLTDNTIFVSVASIWEISIKQSLDRLEGVPNDFYEIIKRCPVEILSITGDHAYAVRDLPRLHGDPFDRILIAQAQVEGFTLVTRDSKIVKYDIPTLLA